MPCHVDDENDEDGKQNNDNRNGLAVPSHFQIIHLKGDLILRE
jgi:hypothetical protein